MRSVGTPLLAAALSTPSSSMSAIGTRVEHAQSALLAADVPAATIRSWCKDPRVTLGNGAEGSVFDAFEDLDAEECLKKAVAIERVDAFGE